MSELKVRVAGDASSFNATLKQAQTNAAAFNAALVAESKRAAQASQAGRKLAGEGSTKVLSSGGKIAAGAAGLAGMAGAGAAIVTSVAYGVAAKQLLVGTVDAGKNIKEAGGLAKVVGKAFSSLRAAAVGIVGSIATLGLIAAAAGAAIWAAKKKVQWLEEQLDDMGRTAAVERDVRKLYIDTLKKNRQFMSEDDYRRLSKGVLKNDREVKSEIVRRFNPKDEVLKKELVRDLWRAQVEAMPEGYRKNVAKENLRYYEDREKLAAKIAENPTDAVKLVAIQLARAMAQEHNQNLADINAKQLEELEKISKNTRGTPQNPFK